MRCAILACVLTFCSCSPVPKNYQATRAASDPTCVEDYKIVDDYLRESQLVKHECPIGGTTATEETWLCDYDPDKVVWNGKRQSPERVYVCARGVAAAATACSTVMCGQNCEAGCSCERDNGAQWMYHKVGETCSRRKK